MNSSLTFNYIFFTILSFLFGADFKTDMILQLFLNLFYSISIARILWSFWQPIDINQFTVYYIYEPRDLTSYVAFALRFLFFLVWATGDFIFTLTQLCESLQISNFNIFASQCIWINIFNAVTIRSYHIMHASTVIIFNHHKRIKRKL